MSDEKKTIPYTWPDIAKSITKGMEADKIIDMKDHTLQDDVKSYYQYEKTFLDEVGGWAQDDNIPSEEWIWYAVSLMAALTVLFILLK